MEMFFLQVLFHMHALNSFEFNKNILLFFVLLKKNLIAKYIV